MLVLRIIHIGLGVFWAGTLIFLAFYLAPAVVRAGPGGGRVMQELHRARLMQVMPAMALLTILSGAWMMWVVSGGFGPTFFRTGYGVSLTIGAVASLVAFVLGVAVMRPAQAKMGELGERMAAVASEEERARVAAETGVLRDRIGRTSHAIAWLLIIAVVTMAAARYL